MQAPDSPVLGVRDAVPRRAFVRRDFITNQRKCTMGILTHFGGISGGCEGCFPHPRYNAIDTIIDDGVPDRWKDAPLDCDYFSIDG
jgi:hypothetical protein